MAYNLNYNPGIDHDRERRRRKMMIIWISVLIVIVAIILMVIGFNNNSKKNEEAPTQGLTAEERSQLVKSMTAVATSSRVYTKDEAKLSQSMSAQSGPNGEEPKPSFDQSQRDKLLKAMRAQ